MSEEKRVIDGFEEKMAIQIGDRQYILAENMMAESPYMVCECRWDNPLGIESYSNGVAGDDYLEMLTEFLSRVNVQVKEIETERAHRGITHIPLTAEDCVKDSRKWNYEGQLVVVKPEALTPSLRTADRQLLLATGGFGCSPDASGTAVFCTNLFTGESRRYERFDIAGVIDPAKMPDWAKFRLALTFTPKLFMYGGYHFLPVRKFTKSDGGYDAIENRFSSDRSMGLSTYEWGTKAYSHDAFNDASADKDCNVFRCMENGKLYVPGLNELFIYTEPRQRDKKSKQPENGAR